MRKPIEKIFATEEISRNVVSLGFNEKCIGIHAGFRQFGEGEDKLRGKFVYNSDVHGPWQELQQKENIPFFPIKFNGKNLVAPTWDQLIDWFREAYDIDIDVIRIRKGEFNFEYTVMRNGRLVSSDRVSERRDAIEKAMLIAIAELTKDVNDGNN